MPRKGARVGSGRYTLSNDNTDMNRTWGRDRLVKMDSGFASAMARLGVEKRTVTESGTHDPRTLIPPTSAGVRSNAGGWN